MLRKFTIILVVLSLVGLTAGCGNKWLTGAGNEKEDQDPKEEETSESISVGRPDSTAIGLDSYSDLPGGSAPVHSGHTVKP